MKNYDVLDLSKFILSFFVVAIHTKLFPQFLYPWLRIAVPMFFVISSFLFFTKVNLAPDKDRKSILKKYVKRQLILYLFWFIALLPVTVFVRQDWFDGGIKSGILTALSNTLFSSTFITSWFIVASIQATVIVYFMSNGKNDAFLLIIFSVVYVICCLRSSYFLAFKGSRTVLMFSKCYETVFAKPMFSFPAALIWIMIGKTFADNKINTDKRSFFIISTLIFLVLLFIEWKYVVLLKGEYDSNSYLSLIPLVFSLFALIKDIKLNIKNAVILRRISVITFPLHASVAVVARKLLCKPIENSDLRALVVFILTAGICLAFSFAVFKLEKHKSFSFLKYSH